MASLLSEIARRKVFRVAAAYLIVAWLLIQIADILAPQLNLPDWAPRFVTFVLLLGFPLALVLAWVFDVTPEGIKAESGSKMDIALYSFAGILALATIGWYAWDRPEAGLTSTERSIAVLPFVNMSGDPDNQYFSDGISEEILNNLAHMPELKVAARTSSFAFRDQQKEIPDIASELQVALVLEGSVRRQADQVRITAQLIEAASGFHLWSETYDRHLKDIFDTQDEIAAAIANALELQLGTNVREITARKADPEVYDKYLRGKAKFASRHGPVLRQGSDMLEEVIAADPDFAEAYAELALNYAVTPFYTTTPRVEVHAKARDAAEHALALDPGNAIAFGSLADVAIHAQRYDLGQALLERAISLRPSFPAAHYWLAEKHLFVGDFEEALQQLDVASQFAARSHIDRSMRAATYLALERPDDARAACAAVLDLAPEHHICRASMLQIALGTGDYALARDLLVTNPHLRDDDALRQARMVANALEGKGDRNMVARQLADTPYHAIFDPEQSVAVYDQTLPALLLALGEPELALGRFVLTAEREPKDVMEFFWDPYLDAIRCDESFQQAVIKLNITDHRAVRICQE